MAYAFTSKHKTLAFIAKDLDQANFVYSSWVMYQNGSVGEMHTITNEEFEFLQTGEKHFIHNGTSWNFVNSIGNIPNKECLDMDKQSILDRIDLVKDKHKGTSWGDALLAYRTIVSNFDTSTFPSFPYQGTLEKYLKSQGHTIISTLQMC